MGGGVLESVFSDLLGQAERLLSIEVLQNRYAQIQNAAYLGLE